MADQSPETGSNGTIHINTSDALYGFRLGRDGLVELSPIVGFRIGRSILEMEYEGLDFLGKTSILPVLLEYGNPSHPEVLQLALSVDLAKTICTELARALGQSE